MLQTLHNGIMVPTSATANPRLSRAPRTSTGILGVRALEKPKQQERKPLSSKGTSYLDSPSRTNDGNGLVTAAQTLDQWKGTVLLERQNFLDLSNQVANVADKLGELVGQKVYIQLVSVEIDTGTGVGKRSKKAHIEGWIFKADAWTADSGTEYSIKFEVDKDFGIPGAILVENHHPNAFFLRHLTLQLDAVQRQIHFPCNSWVYNHSKYVRGPRIFFSNEAYLRKQTPSGLQDLRLSELQQLRGDGTGGQRLESDRIYDYDVYNDLGNPDKGKEFIRPVLGGSKEFPYPRRCRTGRDRTKNDPESEKPQSVLGSAYYVPRDEQFGRIKNSDFLASALKSIAHDLLPIITMFLRKSPEFKSFSEIYELYSEIQALRTRCKSTNKEMAENKGEVSLEIIRAFTDPRGGDPNFLRYPVPEIIQASNTEWARDEEFARQRLSGMNPMVIERLTVFPPVSNLDPKVYGPPTSSITAQHIESNLEGLTVQEALQHNKLYTMDYHDVYLPYLERINALDGSKAYASRTLLFLTKEGTLKPVAIELSLPPTADDQGTLSGNSRVFVPPRSGEKDWLWQLAKTHATINDMGVHELVSHLLRTHACIEPFIIASHRQLSVLHPLHVLLLPHFKNTMNINAIARKNLINCFDGSVLNGGIIEAGFTPGRYSMEMSSAKYKEWRFDEEGLPADLLKRGMAVKDKNAKHGLRLMIEDYPFAVDGLEIWQAIMDWVREYLSIYYENDRAVQNDSELQSWWKEIREEGHGDKKDEEWWKDMTSVGDLEEVVVTLIWVASAHHAAVNFGQFSYAGFMPNMPSMGRLLIPHQDPERFSSNPPPGFFLSSISTKAQSIVIIAVLEILSTHASDEEYLGHRSVPHWTSNPKVLQAFDRFKHTLAQIEQLINQRNHDPRLKNRRGPPQIPYTLLSPSSTPGLTGNGIPNSTSI